MIHRLNDTDLIRLIHDLSGYIDVGPTLLVNADECWSQNVLVTVSAHQHRNSVTNMTVAYFDKNTPISDLEVQVVNYRCEILSYF